MTSATEDECSSTDMIVNVVIIMIILVIIMIIMIMVIMVIVIMATVHCHGNHGKGDSPRVISNANLKSLHFYKSKSKSSS